MDKLWDQTESLLTEVLLNPQCPQCMFVCLCPQMGKAEGIINDEIPNCWECPKCHKEGKTSKVRVRPVPRSTGMQVSPVRNSWDQSDSVRCPEQATIQRLNPSHLLYRGTLAPPWGGNTYAHRGYETNTRMECNTKVTRKINLMSHNSAYHVIM